MAALHGTEQAMMAGGLTAEQLAALQGVPMLSPEMLAAAMQPMAGPDGQHVQAQLQLMPEMQHAFAGFDPAALGLVGANFNSMPGMDITMLQQLPPEQLQAILQGHLLMPPAGFSTNPQGTESNHYKNWWDEKDEADLLRMVNDRDYRIEKLGTEDMEWPKLEQYFNRSQNALRKKLWMLSKNSGRHVASPETLAALGMEAHAAAAAAAAAVAAQPIAIGSPSAQPRSRAERKNWSDEETLEMARLVRDPLYRAELGMSEDNEELSWERLATKFNCAVQTAKRKYRHLQEQAAQYGGAMPEKGKRQHFKKNVPYRWMIVTALSKIPGFEATAPQIFESVESDPELRNQLDLRIMPGTKHVPRWKIQIRKVLSADHIFINTAVKQKHETVWRLDPVALQDANADRQRQRAGLPPINLGDNTLPAAPALTGTGPEAIAALHHLPMTLNEQTMAMLQQQQLLQMGLTDPAGHLQILPGMDASVGLDHAALAAMMVNAGIHPDQLTAMAGEQGVAALMGQATGGQHSLNQSGAVVEGQQENTHPGEWGSHAHAEARHVTDGGDHGQ